MSNKATQFKKGNCANPKGRPKGSKHVLAADYLNALSADFAKHGSKAIAKLREKDLSVYMRLVAALVPKDFRIEKDITHYVINAEPELSIEQWRELHMLKNVKEIKELTHNQ